MSEKKYSKEYCIVLLKEKQKFLQSQGIIRYPKRSDFEEREMVAIKAFLGPWPRALEVAGIKPPREVNEQAKEEKKLKKKNIHIALDTAGSIPINDTIKELLQYIDLVRLKSEGQPCPRKITEMNRFPP